MLRLLLLLRMLRLLLDNSSTTTTNLTSRPCRKPLPKVQCKKPYFVLEEIGKAIQSDPREDDWFHSNFPSLVVFWQTDHLSWDGP